MDNRENQENKDYTPTVQPYVRTRRSAAARAAAAAAAAQAQMQNPEQPAAAQAAYIPQQADAMQAPAVRKRSAEQALTAPVVYEPSDRDLRMPSVKPVSFSSAGKGAAAHSTGRLIFFSILLGIVSGVLLLVLHEHNHILGRTDVTDYGEVGMTIHCLVWGGVLGFVYSMILSPFHKRLSSSMPIYAMLLFLPFLLYRLTPLLCMGNMLIIGLVEAVIGLIGAAIGLFLAWTFLCGG